MPDVSVVIPNFNREALIGETLSNLISQTHPPDEIIVVDDGSIDNSVRVIQSFGKAVTLIQQTNQGPGAARNAGLRAATGKFIQFQDSDDLFSLNKLEVQEALLERTGADIAFSPWVKVWIEGQSVTLENHVLQQKMPSAALELPAWWLRGWSTIFQSLLFRRSFLDRVGSYRTDVIIGEDGELFFRALTSFPKVAFSADALTLYRLHETNKLTQNQGTSQARRVTDWAWCLRYMMARQEECGFMPDRLTRLMFLSEVKRQVGYLLALPNPPADLVEFLSRQVAVLPTPLPQVVALWTRLTERFRLQMRGSRWMKAFQASPPTKEQMKLMREIGFNLLCG